MTSVPWSALNALCQGVPALGTGWSHKYEMLFRDYGFEDGIIPVPCEVEQLAHHLYLVLDPDSRHALAERLRVAAARQNETIEEMWRDVFDVLTAD